MRRTEAGRQTELFAANGARKYLSGVERRRFMECAARKDRETRLLCQTLTLTGCRISEALELTPTRLDSDECRIVFRTLKRRKCTFRTVPVPNSLISQLAALGRNAGDDTPLWRWCRQTAWRRVKAVMDEAGVAGIRATPKGLRHSFGIANAEQNVPPAITQRWMGHARLETTAIYQQASGDEERAFAERLWAH